MTKKLVIFLLGSSFNPRHAERIGIDLYRSANIDFFVWECFFQRSIKIPKDERSKFESENVNRLTSIRSVNRALDTLTGRKAIFIDSLGVDLTSRITRLLIKNRGHKIGLLKIQHLLEPQSSFIKRAYKKIRSFRGLTVRLNNAFLKIVLTRIRYDFIIYAGSEGLIKDIPIKIETCTYDVAHLNCCDKFSLEDALGESKRYIVFLDNGSYVHPDSSECHLYIKGELVEFTRKLKTFFSNLESKTGARIIIAAHPKVPEKHYSDFYKDFQVEFGKTASLTKGAIATCMVQSNSMGFAVLSKKPIIIITDNNHKDSYIGDYQIIASEILGCKIINLDRNERIEALPTICQDRYDHYAEKYLASKCFITSKTVWSPFINVILCGEL